MRKCDDHVASATARTNRAGRQVAAAFLAVAAFLYGAAGGPGFAGEIAVDSLMYNDPPIEVAVATIEWPPELKTLWLEALSRPESELQREAADAIARAHALGMPDLASTAEALVGALGKPNVHASVRYAVVRALIALEAKDKAPVLWEQAQTGGPELAQLVEPVLLKWQYEPLAGEWIKRLNDPDVPASRLLLAVRGLGELKETQAEARLLELVKSPTATAAVRLESARALGKIRTEGLVAEARSFLEDKTPKGVLKRLMAASLVAHHSGDEAVEFLRDLADDPEPAVAVIAMERLLAIDHKLLGPRLTEMLASSDSKIRNVGIRALAAEPSDPNLRRLAPLLDDPHPDNRILVRDTLLASANDQTLGPVVRELAMEMLASDKWRGIEQSALLLATLDHKPAADRLAQLLEFDRPEVFVTAAWALRKLAVSSTLPAMMARVENVLKSRGLTMSVVDEQVSQIFQAIGKMKYAEAKPLLSRFIPRSNPGFESRAAAIWALGLIHEGNPDADLVNKFAERLADVEGNDPEDERVRRMSAISIGRMGSDARIGVLRRFAGWRVPSSVACLWAISRITNEPMPAKEVFYERSKGWFLEPSG